MIARGLLAATMLAALGTGYAMPAWARTNYAVLMAVTANAFLHHMVRNLVGALVYVGDGRRPVEWMAQVLASRNRSFAAPTFAASGLYLASVRYDPQWQLPIAVRAPRVCELV